eukprot:350252-Chlamydomonas_euryale.AAC.3
MVARLLPASSQKRGVERTDVANLTEQAKCQWGGCDRGDVEHAHVADLEEGERQAEVWREAGAKGVAWRGHSELGLAHRGSREAFAAGQTDL